MHPAPGRAHCSDSVTRLRPPARAEELVKRWFRGRPLALVFSAAMVARGRTGRLLRPQPSGARARELVAAVSAAAARFGGGVRRVPAVPACSESAPRDAASLPSRVECSLRRSLALWRSPPARGRTPCTLVLAARFLTRRPRCSAFQSGGLWSARPPSFGQADCDGLLERPRRVLFPPGRWVNLLADELPRLGAQTEPCAWPCRAEPFCVSLIRA